MIKFCEDCNQQFSDQFGLDAHECGIPGLDLKQSASISGKHRDQFDDWLEYLRKAVRDPEIHPQDAIVTRHTNGRVYVCFSFDFVDMSPEEIRLRFPRTMGFFRGNGSREEITEKLASEIMDCVQHPFVNPVPIRGVDYVCEECKTYSGSSCDSRGFNRCLKCGFPGQ